MATCKDCIHFELCDLCEEALCREREVDMFKDKSRSIELPCKVGDTVWAFEECFGTVLPFFVEQIIIDYEEKEPCVTYCANCYNAEEDELLADIDFDSGDIGKTVFLTCEEAEKALAERNEINACQNDT